MKRPSRRYLGTWVLPRGNRCDAYLERDTSGLSCEWDRPPSAAWPPEDLLAWRVATFPEIIRAVATATGLRVAGVSL